MADIAASVLARLKNKAAESGSIKSSAARRTISFFIISPCFLSTICGNAVSIRKRRCPSLIHKEQRCINQG